MSVPIMPVPTRLLYSILLEADKDGQVVPTPVAAALLDGCINCSFDQKTAGITLVLSRLWSRRLCLLAYGQTMVGVIPLLASS
jgi:N-acyl-L-homoserine lactone synthetase